MSFLSEYDVFFVWIWRHFCLNMTSFLSEYDVIFVWIWRHFCLNMMSFLSEYDVTFVWIWCHICLNMTSYLFVRIEPNTLQCVFPVSLYVTNMFFYEFFLRGNLTEMLSTTISRLMITSIRVRLGCLSAFLIKTLAVGRNTNRYVLVSRCVLADSKNCLGCAINR